MRIIKRSNQSSVSSVPWMVRNAIALCVIFCAGCVREPARNAADQGTDASEEDGGVIANADRDKAEAYFVALGNVQSVAEEEELLTEFAEWLKKNGYKIRVVEKSGKYELSCPFFPPVTPWATYKFFDVNNLQLLPFVTTADNNTTQPTASKP